MLIKNINLPSTINFENNSFEDFLDINSMFWDYLFSEKLLNEIIINFKNKNGLTDFDEKYLEYIKSNISDYKIILTDCNKYEHLEKNLFLCFKIFFYLLGIINFQNSNYKISLPYGILFLKEINNISLNTDFTSNYITIFFDKLLENSFFEDNTQYNIKIHWENELYCLALLSQKIRKKFKNVKIIIDFSQVNEQADFTQWINNDFIKKIVDNFDNVYHENTSDNRKNIESSKKIKNEAGIKSRSFSRLFKSKCYWNKCSFCTINSRHKSSKVYDSLTDEVKKEVDNFINDLAEMNEMKNLTLSDEAIEGSILLYFAEQLLKKGISIKWKARTRISDKFTFENCKILARSGLTMIGLGLESVNKRILNLMNKRDRDYSVNELNSLIDNFDRNNISVHTYFIIGFPSETKKETNETLKFIDFNLKKRKYFTYSANRFLLMKNSEIYNNPEKFGIKIIDMNNNIKLGNINYIDNNPGIKYSKKEIYYLSQKTYSKMFFKKVKDDYSVVLGYQFWDFIDRTGLFYKHKNHNNKNPYWNIKKNIDEYDFDTYYKIINIGLFDEYKSKYYDIINEKYIKIDKNQKKIFYSFLKNYNPVLTLNQNIKQNLDLNDKKFLNHVIQLIDCGYLYQIKE